MKERVGCSILVWLILRHVRNDERVELNGSYVHTCVEDFPYVAFCVIGFCSNVPGRYDIARKNNSSSYVSSLEGHRRIV